MLPDERASVYRQFIREYEIVRQAEGRGSDNAAYYHALPFADLSGKRSDEWAIRSRSFQTLLDQVIAPLERQANRPLHILDMGAGNCWLSNRLSQRGHRLAAIDLLTNSFDGLGSHIHYDTRFIPIQAEFDHLPLANMRADLVIFNASFHYSTNYNSTLQEALRVLTGTGQIIALDTPIYHQSNSGIQMVQERQMQFKLLYGFPSDAISSENFLTEGRLDDLADTFNLHWRKIIPRYGLRWWLRPWIARLRNHREPARFVILIGERNK